MDSKILALKALNWYFFRKGDLVSANLVLRLLRTGSLTVGLERESLMVELELQSMGIAPRYNQAFTKATFSIRPTGP